MFPSPETPLAPSPPHTLLPPPIRNPCEPALPPDLQMSLSRKPGAEVKQLGNFLFNCFPPNFSQKLRRQLQPNNERLSTSGQLPQHLELVTSDTSLGGCV